MKSKLKKHAMGAGAAIAAGAWLVGPAWADELRKKTAGAEPASTETEEPGEKAEAKAKAKAEAVKLAPPKEITAEIRRGLRFLAKVQNKDGGWGQGGGWRAATDGRGRVQGDKAEDRSDVGNSCVAMLAFLRAGENLRTGEHAESLRKGVEYLYAAIEKSDEDSLWVTHIRDTQLQSKIGRYVDTFLAAQILAELKGEMTTPEAERRREKLLDKVIAKIGKHQNADGAFRGNAGWASVLSQGLCSRSLNAARLAGAQVTDEMLERDNKQNLLVNNPQALAGAARGGAGAPTSAGIALYWKSSKVRGQVENSAVNGRRAEAFKQVVASQSAPAADKQKAQVELQKIAVAEKAKDAALAEVAQDVAKEEFVKGFGNNGGEEFLSYMNISETLRLQGGKGWSDWDKKITGSIHQAQNEDGSWSGHHCITGRTFCTSGALLTLMADRAPLPPAPEAAPAITGEKKERARERHARENARGDLLDRETVSSDPPPK